MQKGLSIFDLPEFAKKNGFEGIEISDRESLWFSESSIQRLSQKCSQNNCGLIVDVNADLCFSKHELHIQEIKHIKRMIYMANLLNVGLLRICLGGQFISIQNILKKYRKSIATNKPVTSSDTTLNKR